MVGHTAKKLENLTNLHRTGLIQRTGVQFMLHTPHSSPTFFPRWASMTGVAFVGTALAIFSSRAQAHGISEASSETMADGGILEYIWLGAEHMVTGYDHLLFLFGVIFFLTGFRDVVRFITAFTLGHCITLLGATLAGVTADAHLIDAVIALSVVYKGFENLGGFKKTLGIRAPNLLAMVFIFGLIHGFGLSTRLQELPLGDEGLISRILAFNVGVELGQVAALTVMLGVFKAWRATQSFERFGALANTGLVLAGAGLFVYQVNGYIHQSEHADSHGDEEAQHEVHHDDQPDTQAVANPNPTVPEPIPDDAATEEPSKTEHGHGHGHGHGHEPDKKVAEEPSEAPVEEKKSHGHGSGGTHSH